MKNQGTLARVQRVAEMRNAGATYAEIAKTMNRSEAVVARDVRRARELGLMPAFQHVDNPGTRRNYLAQQRVMPGRMSDVVEGIERDQFEWLTEQVRLLGDGATLAEYLTELVRDEHAKDVDGSARCG